LSEKKQSYLGGAAILAATVALTKVIGAIYKIPLYNILGDEGTAHFQVMYTIYNLILTIAIAELTSFESIPVKVTLDEWIDIAKFYSSPTSSNFVNGVLDKIVAELTESGRIQKSGRGLL
jgi:O-antigen/teichoic acid export membrane protein